MVADAIVITVCLLFVAWREFDHNRQINELLSRLYQSYGLPPTVRSPLDQVQDVLRKEAGRGDNDRPRPGFRVKEVRSFPVK